MPEFEESGFRGFWLPGRRLTGEHGLTIVAKRRFRVDTASADCEPADETPEILDTAELTDDDDPAGSAVERPAEIAVEKPYVDLLVRGTAYAPGGKRTPEFEVALRIPGVLDRRLRIVGPRTASWVEPDKWLSDKDKAKGEVQEFPPPVFSEPQPIEKLPLRYEFAYGGAASIVLAEEDQEVAEEHQEEAKQEAARRKRKKEIQQELRAEEEAKAKEAAAAEEAERSGIGDEEAREKAEEAFREEGTRVLDAEAIRSLDALEHQDEEMVPVSEYRLGRDLPERPEDEEPPEEERADEEAANEAADGEEEDEESPFSEGTRTLDAADLEAEDELKEILDEEDRARREALRDEEGTHIVRGEGMEDVTLAGEAWIDEAGARPEAPREEPEESPHPQAPYPANPLGRGFCVSPLEEAVDGLALPCIEDPDAPLRPEELVRDLAELDLAELEAAAGFAPYPGSWYPRAGLSGVMPWDEEAAEEAKQKALAEYDPEDPDDQLAIEQIEAMEIPVLHPRWYNEAHPDLQVERLYGNEEVYVDHLTPDGHLFFRLPGRHPTATVDLGGGASGLFLRLDTVTLDLEEPESPAVELLWRGWYPLRDFEQLAEATKLEVHLAEVGQEDWMDRAREEELGEPGGEGGTRTFEAMPEDDEEDEGFVEGQEADRRYKEGFAEGRGQAGEVGPPTDEGGTVVLDTREEHRLSDEWEQDYEEEAAEVDEEAAARAAEAEEEKEAAIRAKARDKADEEFGIVRDEDGDGDEGS